MLIFQQAAPGIFCVLAKVWIVESSAENGPRGYLVFGATGAVGSELSRRLVAGNQKVLLAGRSAEKLQTLANELQQPFAVVTADDSASIDAAFETAGSEFGGLTGVANCIGSVLLKPAHSTSDADWQDVLTTNLFSSFAIVRSAAKRLRKQGGAVVLVSSAAADVGMANHEAIAAAKAGVVGLMRSAAATYASKGVRFNAIAPGLVRSEMTKRIWGNEQALAISERMHPQHRIGQPAQIASGIHWLLQPEQHWITGTVINIDGGLANLLPQPTA